MALLGIVPRAKNATSHADTAGESHGLLRGVLRRRLMAGGYRWRGCRFCRLLSFDSFAGFARVGAPEALRAASCGLVVSNRLFSAVLVGNARRCAVARLRLTAYSQPSTGPTCGGSRSRYGRPIPNSFSCASIHFHSSSLEAFRCVRFSPLTLTISAASAWP